MWGSRLLLAAVLSSAAVASAAADQSWFHGRHGRGAADWCGPQAAARLDGMLTMTEAVLRPTAGQRAAWEAFAAAAKTARAELETVCGAAHSLPDKLAATAAALDKVRPALDALYGVLDGEQRQWLDGMGQRRRG